MTDSLLLSSEKVGFSSADKTILENVSVELRRRQITTLIGPNGAGKTTLLKILLKALPPTTGSVWHQKNLKIGYMPQRLTIDRTLPLSVKRLLSLSTPKEHLEIRLEAVLDRVGALSLKNRWLRDLSGGELQRILLARALLLDPDILILDEPVQGVDILGQAELYQLIAQIRDQQGCGVLLVSHDLHLVMAASDNVLCLNRHICCAGHPGEVQNHPSYKALFDFGLTWRRQEAEKVLPQGGVAPYWHHHDHRHDD